MSNLINHADQKSDSQIATNCFYEFLAGDNEILNIETSNGRIEHGYFFQDHDGPEANFHTRVNPILLASSHTVSVFVRGSHEINEQPISRLVAEFAKSNRAPLDRPVECADLFCAFLKATFRGSRSSQIKQLKKLTASYYLDVFERIDRSYREALTGLHWRPDEPSPFKAPMEAMERQWFDAATLKPFEGRFGEIVLKYGGHVFDALDDASGDFGLTGLDGCLLLNMVFGRLCSTSFSPIKSSIFFSTLDSESNVSVARLDTDGMFAGHLKATVNVLSRRDQSSASNSRVRH